MRTFFGFSLLAAVAIAGTLAAHAGSLPPPASAGASTSTRKLRSPAAQPLAFEENRGQVDGQVSFLCRAASATVFLTEREAVFQATENGRKAGGVVRMQLVGARRAA